VSGPEAEVDPAAVMLPTGARDVLPDEADALRQVEADLRSVIETYGYREVITPVLELAAVVDRAEDGGLGRSFRLFDDHGRVMLLRPDLTIPVARLVATRFASHPGPIRVRYTGRRFRPAQPGRPEPVEERQAGFELVGASGPEADAEVVVVLVQALRRTGLTGVRIAIGDVELCREVLEALDVGPDARKVLAAALAERNLVAWRQAVGNLALAPAAAALVSELPTLRGGTETLGRIRQVVPEAAGSCDWLQRVLDLADEHGVGDALTLDFGVLRDWSYYSGAVFEAYTEGASRPIAVGGRYDGLGARFGRGRAAVGVAIALEPLRLAVSREHAQTAGLRHGLVLAGGFDQDLDLAAGIRATGTPVIAAGADPIEAEALAQADGWRFLARPTAAGLELVDRTTGARYPADQIVAVLEGARS
jgi:ATP phosphoribosyltransferase regulatory subunit